MKCSEMIVHSFQGVKEYLPTFISWNNLSSVFFFLQINSKCEGFNTQIAIINELYIGKLKLTLQTLSWFK